MIRGILCEKRLGLNEEIPDYYLQFFLTGFWRDTEIRGRILFRNHHFIIENGNRNGMLTMKTTINYKRPFA